MDEEYTPPQYNAVSIKLQPKQNQNWNAVSINLTPDNAESTTQYIGGDGIGFDSLTISNPVIKLSYVYLAPKSIASSLIIGVPYVKRMFEQIKPPAINSLVFGTAKLENKHRKLFAVGRDSALFGTLQIKSLRSYIISSGFNSFRSDKNHNVEFANRKITPTNPIPSHVFGNLYIDYAVRYRAVKGSEMSRFGLSWIALNPRFLEPRGIFQQYNAEHKVSPKIILFAEGFDAARYTTRIIPEIQTIYTQGFSETYGLTKVDNYKQIISAKGFFSSIDRWGWPEVYNKTIYIEHRFVQNDGLNPFQPSNNTNIINRNRTVLTHGQSSEKFGYQLLYNNAHALKPTGISSPIEVTATRTFIADRIRKLSAIGIAEPDIASWSVIRNNAQVIKPDSIEAQWFGNQKLENTRRFFRFIGMGETQQFGNAMIADAVRTITCTYEYSIEPPVIKLPTITNMVSYIEPVSINHQNFGRNEIVTRFNKIFPRYVVDTAVGEPILKNKNYHPKVRGEVLTLFGTTQIQLYKRYINQWGDSFTGVGKPFIGDNKKNINAPSIKFPPISEFHEIYAIGTGHYPVKKIATIGFDVNRIGSHRAGQNVISVNSEDLTTKFGSTSLRANSIFVQPGYWEELFGDCEIKHKNRYIKVEPWIDVPEIPRQALTPHTIYAATPNVPQQAIDNHDRPKLPLHYIDGLTENWQLKPTGVTFGKPNIDYLHRRANITIGETLRVGSHAVILTQYKIEPSGWNSAKIGLVGPLGDQKVILRVGIDGGAIGSNKVSHYVPYSPFVSPKGFVISSIGKPTIEHKNRTFKINGFDALLMGQKKAFDTPFMWQGLRVGPNIPFIVGNNDFAAFGSHWISLRIRDIKLDGFDSAFVSEYEPSKFKDRIRVKHKQIQQPEAMTISTIGFDSFEQAKATDIKNKVHFIRPDGNSDQYRKGAQKL